LHQDDQKKIPQHIDKLCKLEANCTYEFEYRIKNEQNEWIWYLSRNIVFKNDNEAKSAEILGTTTNISKQKEAEEKSEKALEVAEKALEIKAEFLSNMSHEIRTPMNAIMGLSDIILQEELEHSVEDNLKSIKQSADNLLVIINDILDFSKIEAGKVKIENISFNFIYQIEHIKKTMAFKAIQKDLDFHVNINNNIPKYLKGDPYRLNQVILNLCSNAIKFTQHGSVTIDVELQKLDEHQASIYFSITDTGIGISKDRQQEIFQSFTQADVKVTRQFGGTGLGLTITKQLIGLMGGKINVESTPGKGSKFFFCLDFDIPDQSEELNDESLQNEYEKSLSGLNILVLEDNIINQKVISQILSNWSCKYSLAENGFKGINKLKNDSFDLVLMDLQMPQLDGFETTKAIRTGGAGIHNLRIPIIALTADAFPETKKKVMEIGMNDLVSKPFNKGVLNSKIFKLAQEFCPENLDVLK
jgi:signal transduction histidine kinase/ActR/RegA family two-component response regulator